MLVLTRPAADAVLIDRVGPAFAAVGKSVLVDGTNPDTAEPWRYSLGLLGITPAAYPTVADGDFQSITPASLPQLLDVAELHARRLALGALLDVDQQVDRDSQKWDQLGRRWQARVDELVAYCRQTYGYGVGTLSAGTIDFDFQDEPCPWDGGGCP